MSCNFAKGRTNLYLRFPAASDGQVRLFFVYDWLQSTSDFFLIWLQVQSSTVWLEGFENYLWEIYFYISYYTINWTLSFVSKFELLKKLNPFGLWNVQLIWNFRNLYWYVFFFVSRLSNVRKSPVYHVYLKDHCAVCEKLSRSLGKYQPNYIQLLQKVESGAMSRKNEDFIYLRTKIQEINLQKLEHMQVST